MRKTALLLVILGLGCTPAYAQNREHLQMAADLRILQQQNQELAAALAQAIQLLNDTAKALNGRLDQTNDLMRKGFADQGITLNAAAGDARKTLAQTQDIATRLGELREEVTALRAAIPAILSRLNSLNSSVPVETDDTGIPAAAGSVPAGAGQAPPSLVGADPQRMFDAAYREYAEGRYAEAVASFDEFIKTFPTSPRAAIAQQYLGDSEFQQNRFEPAIAAYNKVIQNYPKSDQIPWAYFKRGISQNALQQAQAARASFEAVIKQYPESEPAVMALARLQAMDAPQPARK
jgi:tol-pal system protein YbgF